MGIKVVYLEVAVNDLKSVYKYISRDSKKYADLEISKIRAFFNTLRTFPLKGKYYDTIKNQEIRSIVFRNYVIFYVISEKDISILSIRHHAHSFALNPAFKEEE